MIEIARWTRSLGRRPPEISAHPHGHADLGMAEHLYDGRAGRPDLLRRVAACRRLSDCLLATIGRRITLVAELAGGRGGRGPGLIYRRCRHPGSSWRLAVGRRRFRDRGRGPPDRHGRGHLEVPVVRDRPDRQPDAGLRIVTGLLAGVYAGLVLLTPRVLTLNSPGAVGCIRAGGGSPVHPAAQAAAAGGGPPVEPGPVRRGPHGQDAPSSRTGDTAHSHLAGHLTVPLPAAVSRSHPAIASHAVGCAQPGHGTQS